MRRLFVVALIAFAPVAVVAAPPRFEVVPGFRVEAAPKAAAPACPCPLGDCSCAPADCACAGCRPGTTKTLHPQWFALLVAAGEGVGSGTPVYSAGGKTLVLTNAHVARQDRTTFAVTVPGAGTYPARRVDGSAVRSTGPSTIAIDGVDLAVVEVDAELGAVQIASTAPAPGESVFQWGYGGTQGAAPWAKAGVVLPNPFADPTLTSTINCVPGDSGSGVFDKDGKLVGVSHGTGAGFSHHAVPLAEVRAFVRRPLLAKLFPRLADRLEARAAAQYPRVEYKLPAAPPVAATPFSPPVAGSACPGGVCPPQGGVRYYYRR